MRWQDTNPSLVGATRSLSGSFDHQWPASHHKQSGPRSASAFRNTRQVSQDSLRHQAGRGDPQWTDFVRYGSNPRHQEGHAKFHMRWKFAAADPLIVKLEDEDAEVPGRDAYCKDGRGQWMRPAVKGPGWERYCTTCNIWRPPRASHCNICGYCIVSPSASRGADPAAEQSSDPTTCRSAESCSCCISAELSDSLGKDLHNLPFRSFCEGGNTLRKTHNS